VGKNWKSSMNERRHLVFAIKKSKKMWKFLKISLAFIDIEKAF
jgi:hypothetical protein